VISVFSSIAPKDVLVQYGGFARSNDAKFTRVESSIKELTINAGEKKLIEIALEQVLHFLLSFVYTKPFTTASVFCTVTLDNRPLEPNVFPLHSRTLDMDNVVVEQHARNELIQKYTILQPDLDTITNCFYTAVTICVLKETNSTDEF